MAVQGPLTWFDRSMEKLLDGTIKLDGSQSIKAVLLASTQAVDRTFLGSSGDARYADLTAELTTAGGYTNGGLALSSIALSRVTTSRSKFTSSFFSWTITTPVTFKYMALYVFGATNKDLLMVTDMDVGGGSVTANAGALQFTPDATLGWGYWEQP